MNRIFCRKQDSRPRITLCAILFVSASVFAANYASAEEPPETVLFRPKMGDVAFPHMKHAGMMECETCHHPPKPKTGQAGEKGKGAVEEAEEMALVKPKCSGCHGMQKPAPAILSHEFCRKCHLAEQEEQGRKKETGKQESGKVESGGKEVGRKPPPYFCEECHKPAKPAPAPTGG